MVRRRALSLWRQKEEDEEEEEEEVQEGAGECRRVQEGGGGWLSIGLLEYLLISFSHQESHLVVKVRGKRGIAAKSLGT